MGAASAARLDGVTFGGPASGRAMLGRPVLGGAVLGGAVLGGTVLDGPASRYEPDSRARRGDGRVRPERAMAGRPSAAGRPAPMRLTRRGRVVVATLAVLLAASVATLAWLALAARAEAAGPARSGNGARQALTRIVVRPGQTLWSIASQAEPAVDPRQVISQIIEINSLNGAGIQIGQVLWVPRG